MNLDAWQRFSQYPDARSFFRSMKRYRANADYWREVAVMGVDAMGSAGERISSPMPSNPTELQALRYLLNDGKMRERAQRKLDECEDYLGAALVAIEAVRVGLGEKYADALDLHYMDGHTERDTADLMDVSRATVARWIGTALDWCDYRGRELFM